ncbi:MAG: ATP-grasp domain-containing protein [Dehalococcoidia bacterium]|nr:MAG: ATP-grasp domain-containing protein [Dehalococcoidia bacterium]
MPRVMLLIPSASYRAPDFMDAAARLGIEVVVGTDKRSPLESGSHGGLATFDFVDPEHGANEIEAYATLHPVDTIVAVDDGGTLLAARASRRLELPHNPVSAVEATRNKSLLRARIAAAGLPSPAWHVAAAGDTPEAVARTVRERIGYPVVLKPLALSASRGVIRADDEAAFARAFTRVVAILSTEEALAECGAEHADRVLIEGYIPGIEVSLEGLLDEGRLRTLAIFDKPDPLVGPFFEETIYVTPSRLPDESQRLIKDTAERACQALGLRDGPVHVEVRLDGEQAFVIDVAARSIGGLCARTLQFGTGMSLEELLLRHATGLDVPSFERDADAAGVMMLPIPHAGTLRAVEGIAAAEAVPLIESITISIPIGGRVVPLPEGTEYLGFIFARGATPAEVEAALRQAHAALTFVID